MASRAAGQAWDQWAALYGSNGIQSGRPAPIPAPTSIIRSARGRIVKPNMPPKRSTGTTSTRSNGRSIARSLGKGTKSGAGRAAETVLQQSKTGKDRSSMTATSTSARLSPTASDDGRYSKELLNEAEGRPSLNIEDRRYDALWAQTQEKMGMPANKPIHSEGMTRIEHILRVFDLDPSYGPCLGMTRLERWARAEKLGDEPPEEIRHILETREGILEYKHPVLHGKGV